MSEVGETYREMNQASKEKRCKNRHHSTLALERAGVKFESKNNGAHLVVKEGDFIVDFWPGTGLWRERGGVRARGYKRLIKRINTLRISQLRVDTEPTV